jgi:hypothetical protein
MKTTIFAGLLLICVSCGTITQAGKATTHQTTKPNPGEPKRKVKAGAFAFGVLFFPSLIIDFATCEIYKAK